MNKELLIIEEAKKLFIEKGINNTSIDDISKACKISKATFYKHFENKESVISSILKNYKSNLENSCKNIDSNFDMQSIDKLKQKIITIWEYKYKIYDLSSYVAKELSKNNEEFYKLQKMNRAYLISEYRKSLLMAYGYNIKDIVYGLEGYENKLTYEDYENYFYQRLNEVKDIVHKDSKIENKNKLLEAIDEIKNQANNNNYHSLTMDAMIAFLATERSLTDKADSLNRIKDKLGGN